MTVLQKIMSAAEKLKYDREQVRQNVAQSGQWKKSVILNYAEFSYSEWGK